MRRKRFLSGLFLSLFALVYATSSAFAQQTISRPRVVSSSITQPRNAPPVSAQTRTQAYTVPRTTDAAVKTPPLVRRTALVTETFPQAVQAVQPVAVSRANVQPKAVTAVDVQNANEIRLSDFEQKLFEEMQERIGIRYVYGTQGPNTYDCSGLIWTVYREAGYDFGRSSAATYWNQFLPVYGDERFQFGTLVFFNSLGHVGIVVDNKGFYHASSSKGVTYSKFDDYWTKRIVGFRRVPLPLHLAKK